MWLPLESVHFVYCTQRNARLRHQWSAAFVCNCVGSTHATNWFRSWKQKYPKCKREGAVGVDGESDEKTTYEQVRKCCDVESQILLGFKILLAEDAFLKTTKRQFWLQKILSGILWVREYCWGAENLAAG